MELLIQPNPVALSLLIPALICGVIALYSFNNKARGSRIFSVTMIGVSLWALTYGGELSSLNLQSMLLFARLEYLFIPTVPVFWLLLVLMYTDHENLVSFRNVVFLFIIPVITISLYYTNQLHYYYYATVAVDSTGPFPLLSFSVGPWYWVHLTYSYFCMLLGIVFLVRRLRLLSMTYRSQIWSLLIGALFPVVVNVFYAVFNLKPLGHLDLTPYAFTLTGLVVARGILRYGLLEIVPVAYETLIESMDDGIVVLDQQNRVVESNKAARQFFDWDDSVTGNSVDKLWSKYPALVRISHAHGHDRMVFDMSYNGKLYFYEVSTSIVTDRKRHPAGKVVQFHDITDRKRAEEDLLENERKFRTFFTTSRDATFISSKDGIWLDCNDAAGEMFGYDNAEELKGHPVLAVYPDPLQRKQYTDTIDSKGFVKDYPATYRHKDGRTIHALLTAVIIRDKEGNIVAYQGTIKDITSLKQAQDDLLKANNQLKSLLTIAKQRNREITILGEMAQWIHSSADCSEAYRSTVKYLADLFGGDSGFIAEVDDSNDTVEVFASFGSPEGNTVFAAADCLALRGKKIFESDGNDPLHVCPHMGPFKGAYISIPLLLQGKPQWLVGLQNNGTSTSQSKREWLDDRRRLLISAGQELALALANVKLNETLREQASKDPLTDMYNRRYMEEMLEKELHRARRSKHSIGFIMADLDHFKNFNDSYGHEAGDLMLKAVADLIMSSTRSEDIACRYGGEEFLIILPSASLQDTFSRAVIIQKAVARITFKYLEQQMGNMTISMGVSAFPDHGFTASELIAAADRAMYRAKSEGRDRVILAD